MANLIDLKGGVIDEIAYIIIGITNQLILELYSCSVSAGSVSMIQCYNYH